LKEKQKEEDEEKRVYDKELIKNIEAKKSEKFKTKIEEAQKKLEAQKKEATAGATTTTTTSSSTAPAPLPVTLKPVENEAVKFSKKAKENNRKGKVGKNIKIDDEGEVSKSKLKYQTVNTEGLKRAMSHIGNPKNKELHTNEIEDKKKKLKSNHEQSVANIKKHSQHLRARYKKFL